MMINHMIFKLSQFIKVKDQNLIMQLQLTLNKKIKQMMKKKQIIIYNMCNILEQSKIYIMKMNDDI